MIAHSSIPPYGRAGKILAVAVAGAVTAAALGLALPPARGQEMFIYPSRGQSQEQQRRDKFECSEWATQQTGFDPTAPQQAAPNMPPPQQSAGGGMASGAVKGAAIGAVGGAIGGDAGKGAAIGAATGAMFGGFRRAEASRQAQAQQQQYQQQQVAAANAKRSNYNRALGTCLQGRGYNVS